MEKEEKLKALDAALAQIEKQYGKGAVMKLGDPSAQMNVETIPTGSLSLDIALGLGGIPKGRIVEIYGPESSGKTTVTLHMVAEVQKRGGIAGFIDAEHALDPVYAKNLGVDIDNLYVSQPSTGEEALEITEALDGRTVRSLLKGELGLSTTRMGEAGGWSSSSPTDRLGSFPVGNSTTFFASLFGRWGVWLPCGALGGGAALGFAPFEPYSARISSTEYSPPWRLSCCSDMVSSFIPAAGRPHRA